jgi:hypothetical protein
MVPLEDKVKIEELPKTRKWNPCTRRHTVLAEILRKFQDLFYTSLLVGHRLAKWQSNICIIWEMRLSMK